MLTLSILFTLCWEDNVHFVHSICIMFRGKCYLCPLYLHYVERTMFTLSILLTLCWEDNIHFVHSICIMLRGQYSLCPLYLHYVERTMFTLSTLFALCWEDNVHFVHSICIMLREQYSLCPLYLSCLMDKLFYNKLLTGSIQSLKDLTIQILLKMSTFHPLSIALRLVFNNILHNMR